MLSQSELTSLQKIINDDTKSFEDLKIFSNSFFNKSIHYKVGITLSILIKDNQLSLSQEISSFYILYCLSEDEREKGFFPLNSLIIDILKETKIKTKRIFLFELLKNKITNNKIKIKDYINYTEQFKNNKKLEDDINLEIIKLSNNKEKILEKDLYLNPMIHEKKITDKKINDINNNNVQLTSEEPLFYFFKSNYMSYYESSTNLFRNEPYWIFPMLKHNFIWENNTYDKISFLLNQLLSNTPLTNEDCKYIITTFSKNPNIIKNINFTPDQMMSLIEKNESLSFEILAVICRVCLNE